MGITWLTSPREQVGSLEAENQSLVERLDAQRDTAGVARENRMLREEILPLREKLAGLEAENGYLRSASR
jgi:hypothetical protein